MNEGARAGAGISLAIQFFDLAVGAINLTNMTIKTTTTGRAVSAMLCGLALLSTAASATPDFGDIDSDLMRGMEDAIKDLEPVLGAGNLDSALADAEVLRDGLQWVEQYFVTKGGVEDGVTIAQEGRAVVARLLDQLAAKNIPGAIEAARSTAKNCRSCHDIYKP
jgi:hypothetical protein